MKKDGIVKMIFVCLTVIATLTILYCVILNKERAEIFENLICKDGEISVEKIDINHAMSLQGGADNTEQYLNDNKIKQDITSLVENKMIKNMECHKIVYSFGFKDVDNIDGEIVALAVISNYNAIKNIEDIIIIGTNMYSEKYELIWVTGSESLEMNVVENSARVSISGYLKVKLNGEIYYSNTINPVFKYTTGTG